MGSEGVPGGLSQFGSGHLRVLLDLGQKGLIRGLVGADFLGTGDSRWRKFIPAPLARLWT